MISNKITITTKFVKKLFCKISSTYKTVQTIVKKNLPEHPYRVLSIEQNEDDSYVAVIQVRNKKDIFRMHPEEILSNDSITDSFSQRDIRTLSYLGYLGINSPKYKILAKRLSENDAKLIFALQERGNKKSILKTASEISSDEKMIAGLHQKDAHMIGYVIATEQVLEESKQKQRLLIMNSSKQNTNSSETNS